MIYFAKISCHLFFSFCFCFSCRNWLEIDENFSALFCFFFFILFFVFSSLVFKGNRQEAVENFSSLFFFSFSSFSSYILYLYYAQDGFKKWQEIFNKIGLTIPDKTAVYFSSLYFSSSLSSFSRFLYFLFTMRREVLKKWQEMLSRLGLRLN